ncbi:MAG: hypothetical protein LBC49_02955 [Bacteroidales bacterium]|jgi:hypothetical protein|nr:hypothetical protein [Bacteroidales bacterium]
MKKLFAAVLAIFIANALNSQDVEQVIKAPWLTITGGFQTSGSAYSGFNIENRRDPFGYQISANLNFNVKGVLDIPFSLYLSSKNKTFNSPAFNIAGISPRYKWITLHAGVRAMDFSPYTYSGTNFTGGGIELMPENFLIKGKAFYGLLNKKILVGDTSSLTVLQPAYSRYGGGGMITVGTQANNVDLIVFAAADRKKSLQLDSNVAASLSAASLSLPLPQDNIVLGVNTKQKIGEMLLLSASYGFSAFSRNSNLSSGLFEKNISRIFSHAVNLNVDVQTKWFTVGVSSRYIDPNYQTMGALYMTNDIADITLNASSSFWQNRFNVSGSFGFQRNNVRKELASTDKSIIGNINIAASEIVKNLMLSFSYSNYNTSAEAVQVIINDSIKYAQINNNLSFNVTYNFGGDGSRGGADGGVVGGSSRAGVSSSSRSGGVKHSLSLSAIMQDIQTLNNEFSGLSNQKNTIANISISYGIGLSSIGLNGSIYGTVGSSSANGDGSVNGGGTNGSASSSTGGSERRSGRTLTSNIGATLSKSFIKKTLQTSVGYTAGLSGKNTSNNIRFSTGYILKKAHRFNFNVGYLARAISQNGNAGGNSSAGSGAGGNASGNASGNAGGGKNKTGELTATLSYAYNFNMDVVNTVNKLKKK